MDDKTMLELAARACGIDHWYGKEGTVDWDPLVDDAEALRLAVKLSLCVRCFDYSIVVDGGGIDVAERDIKDRYAATRRAIVRAAAEIGKGMGVG